MTADQYLLRILVREAVDIGPYSPVRGVITTLQPMLQAWGNRFLRFVAPSGSFAKGTANHSGTDIDLFLSLVPETSETLKEIHNLLMSTLRSSGYVPKPQNVSVNIRVGGYSVDLVPGKQQNAFSEDHSLFRRKADTWTKTNVQTHINLIAATGRHAEIRILKLWRDQKGLAFPSFYLELTTINALVGRGSASFADNVWTVFQYLRDHFGAARVVDPANTNNVISDDLTQAEKTAIRLAAINALGAANWNQIVV
jgi:hypothetical protein